MGAKRGGCQEEKKRKNRNSRDTSFQIKDSNINSIIKNKYRCSEKKRKKKNKNSIECNSKTGMSSKGFCVSHFKGKKCRSEKEKIVWAIGNASCPNHPHHSIYNKSRSFKFSSFG